MITRRGIFGITKPMVQHRVLLPFVKKEIIARDTYMFYFLRPQDNFDFLPGQYVSVYLDENNPALFRDFSIASSPLDEGYIAIVTKKRDSIYKSTLFTLTPKTRVRFSKPAGGFALDEKNGQPKVFLAGGIGIVPLFNMVRYAAQKQVTTPMTIIASFSSETDMFYFQELSHIRNEHPHVQFVFTITGEHDQWNGEQGRISESLLKKYVSDIAMPQYYLAGSPAFVVAMEDVLEGLQVPLENMKMEQFTGY